MSIQASRKIKTFSFIFTIILIVYHAQWDFFSDTSFIRAASATISRLYTYLGCVGMAFFFMTSGYLLYFSIDETNVYEKIKRRVFSLLLPFVVWNVIYMVGKLIFQHEQIGSVLDILYHFSFAPYNGPMWYVFVIFIFSFIAIPVIKIHNNIMLVLLSLTIILLSFFIYGFNGLYNMGYSEDAHIIMWITRLCRYLPSYIIGCFTGLKKPQYIDYTITSKKRYVLCACAIVLSIIWIYIPGLSHMVLQIILTIQPIAIWLIISNESYNNILSSTIRNSFMMYSIHFMIISIMREVLHKFLPESISDIGAFFVWLLFPIIIVILTYYISYITMKILKQYHLKTIIALITGNRE